MLRRQTILRALEHCLETTHGHRYACVIEQEGLAVRDIVVLLVQLIVSRQHLLLLNAVVERGRTLCLSQLLPMSSSATHAENLIGVLPMAKSFKLPLNSVSRLKICCEYSLR